MARNEDELARVVNSLRWKTRAIKHGWLVYPPNGSRPIAIHRSKHVNRRVIHNIIAMLRRAGADI